MRDDDEFGTFMVLTAMKVTDGGLIHTPEVAIKMAELIMERMQGPGAVERARPWTVVDEGDVWYVTADYFFPISDWDEKVPEKPKTKPKIDPEREHVGPWGFKIQKLDAKIVGMGQRRHVPITELLKPRE